MKGGGEKAEALTGHIRRFVRHYLPGGFLQMRKAIAVAVAVLAVVLALEAQQPERFVVVPDAGSLSVFASNNRLVGIFAAAPVGTVGEVGGLVRMEVISEGVIFLPVKRTPTGLIWGGPDVRFTSSDCTGRAYAQGVNTVGDRAAWVGIEGRLYLWTPGDYSEVPGAGFQTLSSRVIVDDEKGQRVCQQESLAGAGWIPLREVAKLDDDFPPPFSLDPSGKTTRAARH